MAENKQKIKLIKLYELLRKETDEDHPISRVELCRRLNEMGISSNVGTLSEDVSVLSDNGFEIMSFLKDKGIRRRRSTTMQKPQIKVIFSDERLITPSGLTIVGGMLGKSDFVKQCNRIPVDKKRSEPQIKDGDILLTYIILISGIVSSCSGT